MMKNLKIESGRSMVEMLGVLAIIGVLSVGGIAGYNTAMNRHKANQWINKYTIALEAYNTYKETGGNFRDDGNYFTPVEGYTFRYVNNEGCGDEPCLLAFGYPSLENREVCKLIMEMKARVDATFDSTPEGDIVGGTCSFGTNEQSIGSCSCDTENDFSRGVWYSI